MKQETASSSASTEKPVPSITLSITQDDVKRVLDASKAMADRLAQIQKNLNQASPLEVDSTDCATKTIAKTDKENERPPDESVNEGTSIKSELKPVATSSDDGTCSAGGDGSSCSKVSHSKLKRPLHETIFEAAQQCEHPMLQAFLEKMKASGSSPKEVRAGILVFHDLAMPEKFKIIFDVLGDESSTSESIDSTTGDGYTGRTLSREGAQSLFRSVIVAISSCIHKDKRVQIEIEDAVEPEEPPTKKRKVDPKSPESEKSVKSQDNSNSGDSVPALQSPSRSFDSSLGSLKDDDDFATSAVRKEFEEIAMYATDRLVRFSNKGSGNKNEPVAITYRSFEDWRKTEGGKIAPWLELLNLSKWKTPQRQMTRTNIQQHSRVSAPTKREEREKNSSNDAAPERDTPATHAVNSQVAKPESKSSPPKAPAPHQVTSTAAVSSPMFEDSRSSRTVVSFDFTGSSSDQDAVFCINITEENLFTLRNLVRSTGLSNRPTHEVTDILLGASKQKDETTVVPIERFHTCLHQLLGAGSLKKLSKIDKDVFSSSFVDFFSCFDTRQSPLEMGEVDANMLAVGFCFLCAGNKSAKLAAGFAMLESEKSKGLTTAQLTKFLRSYLTMLCGISLLTSSPDGIMKPKLNNSRRKAMNLAVENGSKWTLAHFLKTTGNTRESLHTFEAFANWYTAGGFNVAPWLELLDLKKLLSLLGDASGLGPKTPPGQRHELPPFPGNKMGSPEFTSPTGTHSPAVPSSHDLYPLSPQAPGTEVLFTFPLANQRSMVVLKEDAVYVRKVVDQLGLLAMTPDEIWTALYDIAVNYPPVPPHRGAKIPQHSNTGKSMHVNKSTFVKCMQELMTVKSSRRNQSSRGVSRSAAGARDVLANFFHSFDLLQVDRVALNELMGGLTLLCGGKKSTKLAFAFGVFDQRPSPKPKRGKKSHISNSLGGEDLFLFLRSFLIVMFSCCRQSWDLSDDAVNRYIADTANSVTDDVMRYQWRTRKKDRVDFDEFGQWYNEGGFETAPWLELLDLKKWVLVETRDMFDLPSPGPSPNIASPGIRADLDCPPPPPEDSVDPSFFDDDAAGIMPMDSIDEMDLLLMQPSQDKDNDTELNKLTRSFEFSPGSRKSRDSTKSSNSLKFHLVTEDDNAGYVVSVSQKRIRHLRHILTESGLFKLDGETACREIMAKSYRDEKSGRYSMSKDDYDSAMRGLISSRRMSVESQRALSAVLSEVFTAFDYGGTGQVNATEVACGFTVFCKGKKSDKLEYAFEVLDGDRRGKFSQSDTAKYLRSFLTVLLNVVSSDSLDTDSQDDVMATTGGMRCERTLSTIARAVEAGSSWAASQAFRNRRGSRDTICFDEFAEWYTHFGYINIPWLELLDLHKWVITDP